MNKQLIEQIDFLYITFVYTLFCRDLGYAHSGDILLP